MGIEQLVGSKEYCYWLEYDVKHYSFEDSYIGSIGTRMDNGYMIIISVAINDEFTLSMRRDIIRLSKLHNIVLVIDKPSTQDLLARSLERFGMTECWYEGCLYLIKEKDT